METQRTAGGKRPAIRSLAPALVALSTVLAPLAVQVAAAQDPKEESAVATKGKFYCKLNALTPGERARHKELTDKIVAKRNAIVETPRGYEFQFDPSALSLAELAEWVAAESKCCPFFDFHIDLERSGALLCLRLTGEEGVKPFIRGEFNVPAN